VLAEVRRVHHGLPVHRVQVAHPHRVPRGFESGHGEVLWEKCTLDVVGHLRLAAGKYPGDPRLASLIGEPAMGNTRFRRLWVRADVRSRTHGRKAYRHPLVGLLELHQENFALPDQSGMELLVLSAAPGSPTEDGLRLLATLGGEEHPTVKGPPVTQTP
jgi:hypothetical protein